MKKIYLLCMTTLMGFTSLAQLTLTKTNNQPVIGDMVNNVKYDSTTLVPKSIGTGQNWNFNSLTASTFTEVITYSAVANPVFQSIANIDKYRNGGNPETYNNQTANMSLVGFYDNSGPSLTSFASNPGVWINWPTAFSNSNSDAFSGTETATTFTNNWSGTISYTATGSGTVTMPGGVTHNNCLQLKKQINITISGSQSSTMTITTYEYWSSLERYPILSAEYQTVQTATATNNKVDFFVNAHALTGVQQQQITVKEARIFPNPTIDKIFVELPNNEIAQQIELFDVNGRPVLLEKNTNSVKTSSLAKGLYFVKVKTKDTTLEERIVVTE